MYNILIVDDEKIERSGIRMLLKRMGIELGVFEACNGKQALEYLTSDKNTGIGHIDILLTDVKMPFMDGIELIKNVMHNDISLKTIIFSGYNEFEYAKLAVKLGVKDYILKPVDPSEFSSTITGVITELDEEHKKDEDYNRQANFIKQYYMYTLLNSGDASGILDNGDFLAGYNRLALIEFNTDFFGKYDTGEDIFKEITGELDYQYLNLNPLQSVIIFSDKSFTADGNIDKNIEEMFTNIHDYIYRKTGQFMYIAVSGLFNDYHELPLIEFNTDFFGKYDTGEDIFKEITGELDYQYLNLNPLQSVIIFSDKSFTADGNIDKNIEEMFTNIHDYIYRKTGQFMYIAVSGLFNDYHELPQVMDEVDTLMNNKFYETGRYIFSDNVSEDTPVLVQIDDDALMKQMKQDIKMKDITFLRIHFDALCKKYRGQSNFSHIYIKFVFSNLLKDFYDNIPGADEAEFGREIDRLYKSEDFSCIMDIVNNYIGLLEKSFGKEPATSHREIETVKNYIHNHYGEEIGAQQLADMVYLAPSYLSSLFKKETGQNLSKYIKQYRMEKAKELLTGTNMKIVNISEQVGYPNVSYFVQSFREYFGVSPQKFRDQGELS